jgi:Zn-dependent protease with chaperone function
MVSRVSIIAQLVLGVLASIIVMWFSRQREFRADSGSAQLAGRQKMIGALLRLQQQQGASTLPEKMTAFGSSGPIGSGLKLRHGCVSHGVDLCRVHDHDGARFEQLF